MVSVLVGLLANGCVGLRPMPPQEGGVRWQRYVLAQGATPRELRSPQSTLSSATNLNVPYLLTAADFRYRLDLSAQTNHARHDVVCAQPGDRALGYQCVDTRRTPRSWSLAMAPGCERGSVTDAQQIDHIEAWYQEGTHVGFVLRRGSRLIAAIDTDDTWTRPVWVAHDLDQAERHSIDLAAYVLHDMLRAEEHGGYPFLCAALSSRRRFPR